MLKISPRTVKREWSLARAWLYGELTQERQLKDDRRRPLAAIEQIYEAALPQAPAERAAFLASACGDDEPCAARSNACSPPMRRRATSSLPRRGKSRRVDSFPKDGGRPRDVAAGRQSVTTGFWPHLGSGGWAKSTARTTAH